MKKVYLTIQARYAIHRKGLCFEIWMPNGNRINDDAPDRKCVGWAKGTDPEGQPNLNLTKAKKLCFEKLRQEYFWNNPPRAGMYQRIAWPASRL